MQRARRIFSVYSNISTGEIFNNFPHKYYGYQKRLSLHSFLLNTTQKLGLATHVCRKQGLLQHRSPLRGLFKKRNFSESFRSQESFNFARNIIEPLALNKGNKPALVLTDGGNYREEVSYKELYESSINLCTALSKLNKVIAPKTKELIPYPKLSLVVLPKILPWWVINIAGSWGGFTISPGTSLLTEKDLLYRLNVSEADCIFCGPTHVVAVDRAEQSMSTQRRLLKVVVGSNDADYSKGWVRYEELLSIGSSETPLPCCDTGHEDFCQLFFTSGTTGQPKMVAHTHDSYGRGQIVVSRTWLDLNEDDLLWNVSDTGWAKAAWSSLYAPFIAGATAFVHQMGRFDAIQMLETLQSEPVSVLCAPPTAYRELVQMSLEEYKFRKLRHCVSAGEPLNPEVARTWASKTGLSIYEGYGQSETTLLCATMPGSEIKAGSMGKPAPGYDVKVVDSDLCQLPPGDEGQIVVRTKPDYPTGLFKGYHKDDSRTKAAFQGDFFLTGDRGYFDKDGYLWFVARDDDIIISSGYRIGPFEVESALLEHFSVVEAGVVGVPDQSRGHVVKAFVVLTSEASALVTEDPQKKKQLVLELQAHVKRTTAPYKYPRQVEFVSALPKTVSGKIRRVELRQQIPSTTEEACT